MPASADIYGLIKPIETPNRLAELAQVAQLQNAQLGQQRNQLEMAEFARTSARQNKLAELASQGPDALRKGGFVKEAAAIEKDNEELLSKRQDRMVKGVGFWRDNVNSLRTPEQATQFVQAMYADPNLKDSPITKLPMESFLPQSADPAAFDLWKKEFALGATKFIEMNKPNIQQVDNGQVKSLVAVPGLGGAPTTLQSVQKQATPGEVLSAQTSRENAAATRGLAQATREAAQISRTYDSEQGLRKEFEALPEVKNYKTALPSFNGVKDAAGRNTTQSDINIVYGIAKLYDPTSVVREGEYATVANSPNIPERIKGYAQYLAGGGRLTPKVKAEILAEATSRMKSYEDQFTAARTDFESIAQRSGVDPTRVFPSPAKPATAAPAAAPAAGGGWSIKKVP